jgi:hypothetical protein
MQWVIQDIINSELAYFGYEGVVNGGPWLVLLISVGLEVYTKTI